MKVITSPNKNRQPEIEALKLEPGFYELEFVFGKGSRIYGIVGFNTSHTLFLVEDPTVIWTQSYGYDGPAVRVLRKFETIHLEE